MAYTSKELIWLSRMVNDLQVAEPSVPVLYCDSNAALHIAKNSVFHERTKHIEADCHQVRDVVQDGTIVTEHISMKEQLADLFTKALPRPAFERLLFKLGVRNFVLPT